MAIATLVVDLILKAGGFESDLGRASKSAQKRAKELEREAKRIGAAAGAALLAGATAVGLAVKSAIDRADELFNAAQRMGTSVEFLSRLEYAAAQSDVALESLQGSFVKMTKVQAEAVNTASNAAMIYRKFGVEAIDPLTGKLRESGDVFRDWVDVLSRLDAPEQKAIGMKIFGKSFADLIPLINGGTAALDEFFRKSDEVGNTVSHETAAAAEQFNDKLDELKRTLGGIAMELAAELLPQLDSMVTSLQEVAQSGEAVRKLESVFDTVAIAAKIVAQAIQNVVDAVQSLTSVAIGSLHNIRGAVRLAMGDFAGAAADLLTGKREFDAAREAWASGSGAPNVSGLMDVGGGLGGLGALAGENERTAAAKKAAQEVLDAENKRRAAAEAAAKASKAAAAANREAAEAAREREQRERELAEAVQKVADASAEFTTQAEDLRASIEGPQSQAKLEFERTAAELRKLADDGEISAERLKAALADLQTEFAKTTEEIHARENPQEQLLSDLQFTLDLTNMLTDAERDRAIFMRENTNATEAQADAYVRMNAQLRETNEAIAAADQLRDHFADAFASILDGSKSAKEAFSDLASSIIADIARMLARQWVTSLFGAQGTPLGGSGGGFLSGLFGGGNALGNAFENGHVTALAMGGIVTGPTLFPMANGMGLMGEAGPEAVMPLTRDSRGRLAVHGGGGFQQTLNFNGFGKPDPRTTAQVAATAGREARRALARNGA